MRIAVLDILDLPSRRWGEIPIKVSLTKQYASVMPQAVSAWCRELGHDVSYTAYYGVGSITRQLPADLDVLFVCGHSQGSALAYALAKLYRRRGTLTVIGGPHAKAFSRDCLRFFDLVVTECDQNLIAEILEGRFDPGQVIRSAGMLQSVPSAQQRWPEIRRAALAMGRWRTPFTNIPMIASLGCPYTCNFCIDWDNPYRSLNGNQLVSDLKFIARQMPARALRGGYISFHDPNFAVKFDEVMEALNTLPATDRPPYIMESSLSILKNDRLPKLADTNCIYTAPGIESWNDYSGKSASQGHDGREKMLQVAEHFTALHEHVPGLQGNLIFGLDTDRGREPVNLTKEFMDRTPFAWPTINIPVPFGGTPLFDDWYAAERILPGMPFTFYYAPYLVITLKHYDPIEYYELLIEMFQHSATMSMLRRRWAATPQWTGRLLHTVRTLYARSVLKTYRQILHQLKTDPSFHAYHTGESTELPEFYHREYDRLLGRLAPLMSREDRTPVLEPIDEISTVGEVGTGIAAS